MNTLYQPGIFESVPAVARYVLFNLTEEGAHPQAIKDALVRLSPLANGSDVVLGIGPSLAAALGAEVPGLHELADFSGHGVKVPSTPGTLWCWVRGEDLGDLLHLTRKVQKALAPAFDWDTYFTALGAPSAPLYEVTAPEYFRGLNKLIVGEDLANWKLYLRWQLLLGAAPSLGDTWRTTTFQFASALTGQKQQSPAWRRCTQATDRQLGEALGQVYVTQVFPPESKARAQKMVKDIEAAMGRDIDAVTWMQPQTKQQAHLKLAAVLDKIGYPDHWIDYSTFAVTRDSYTTNVKSTGQTAAV